MISRTTKSYEPGTAVIDNPLTRHVPRWIQNQPGTRKTAYPATRPVQLMEQIRYVHTMIDGQRGSHPAYKHMYTTTL